MTTAALKPQTIDAASGDTIGVNITVTDADGVIVPLTGFTATVRVADLAGNVVADSGDSPPTIAITWPDRVAGKVRFEIDATLVDDWQGTFRWECRLVSSDGVGRRCAYGYLNLPQNLIAA